MRTEREFYYRNHNALTTKYIIFSGQTSARNFRHGGSVVLDQSPIMVGQSAVNCSPDHQMTGNTIGACATALVTSPKYDDCYISAVSGSRMVPSCAVGRLADCRFAVLPKEASNSTAFNS